MIFGIPEEIRQYETRVGATPFLVAELVDRGFQVLVETGAGVKSGFPDSAYRTAGAEICPSQEKLYSQANYLLKVQPPMPVEYDLVRPEHHIFAFFYFANNEDVAHTMLGRGCTCFAYDALRLADGRRPVQDAERRISGEISVQWGAYHLQYPMGGRGLMLGGSSSGDRGKVVIIGDGEACIAAVGRACSMGAEVKVLIPTQTGKVDEIAVKSLTLPEGVEQLALSKENILALFPGTDLLISALSVSRRPPDFVISRADIELLPSGAVVIDLDIENGSVIKNWHATSFDNPVQRVGEVNYIAIPNLACAVPSTASTELSNRLVPYMIQIAEAGFDHLVKNHAEFHHALSIFEGRVIHRQLAALLDVSFYEHGRFKNG